MPAATRYARSRFPLVLLLALSALTFHPAQADDTTPPTVTSAQITPTGTYTAGAALPTLTITATVTDESGGSGVDPGFVFAYILLNGDNFRAASLTKGSGNTYTGTFDLSPYGPNTNPANNVYTAQIGASDLAGNVAPFVTATGSVTQTRDTTKPALANATVTPGIVASGGATVTLKVGVTDNGPSNSGPGSVQADVFRDGVGSTTVPLASSDGVLSSGTFAVPAGDAAPHLWTFAFAAQDKAGNVATVSRYVQQAGTSSLPVPTLTGLSPTAGVSGTSVGLTITGTSFTSSSVVLFGGSVVPATFVSATSLTCAVDGSFLPTAGQVTVQVYNPKPAGGTSASRTFTINTAATSAPALASISPTSRTAGGAQFTLTANGSNFVSGSIIKWNGASQTTKFVSSTKLTATIPASLIASSGTASITVTTPHVGTSGSKTLTINP